MQIETNTHNYLFGRALLNDDEVSQVLRCRGDKDALAWFTSLTAAERGDLIEEIYRRVAPNGDMLQ